MKTLILHCAWTPYTELGSNKKTKTRPLLAVISEPLPWHDGGRERESE